MTKAERRGWYERASGMAVRSKGEKRVLLRRREARRPPRLSEVGVHRQAPARSEGGLLQALETAFAMGPQTLIVVAGGM
jgi:hypothetical protein